MLDTSIAAIARQPGTVTLAPGFFMLQGPHHSRFPFCNSFLLLGRQNVLIDAGIGEANILALDAICRIDVLVISHSHPDHILAWHTLRDRRLLLPRETPDSIYDILQLGVRFTDTQRKAQHWKRRVGDGIGVHPMRAPDERFGDGMRLQFEPFVLEAIHAPGHLNDHYCFLEHTTGTLLTTDIDFTGFGPWYGNPESDITLFKGSIQKVRGYPHRQLCSSHKPPIQKETQRAFTEYLTFFDRQQQSVMALCDPPRTVDELVDQSPFYRNRAPDKTMQQMFEKQMITKNLALLQDAGRVRRARGKFQALR